MKKNILLFSIAVLFLAAGTLFADPSGSRIAAIRKVVAGTGASCQLIGKAERQNIYSQISKQMPLVPSITAEQLQKKNALSPRIDRMVQEKFYQNEEDLKAAAESVFPLYPPNSKVTVNYRQGDHISQYTGTFRKIEGGTAYIGLKSIAVIDMQEESLRKIDQALNLTCRAKYLAPAMKKLNAQKNAFRSQLWDKEGPEFFKLGYILNGDIMTSAQSIADAEITRTVAIQLQKIEAAKRKAEAEKRKAEAEKKKKEGGGAAPAAQPQQDSGKDPFAALTGNSKSSSSSSHSSSRSSGHKK